MPFQSYVTLNRSQRDIINYMRDVYQIDDITVRGGGRHLHVEYVYQGQKRKDTLPQGTGGDPNWTNSRKHDLRKALGEPPPPPATRKRSLEEMTQEAQRMADLRSSTGIGTVLSRGKPVPPPPTIPPTIDSGTGKTDNGMPMPEPKRFPCTIGSKGEHDISFYLTGELARAMATAFGQDRRYTVAYQGDHSWIARPSRDAGRAVEPKRNRLRCAGTDVIDKLGYFTATRAEAVIRHNHVEFRLLERPVRGPVPAPTPSITDLAATGAAIGTASGPPPIVQAPPPAAPPHNARERLRDVLRQIKEIEDEGIYQLINKNGWRWRAADIGLEE